MANPSRWTITSPTTGQVRSTTDSAMMEMYKNQGYKVEINKDPIAEIMKNVSPTKIANKAVESVAGMLPGSGIMTEFAKTGGRVSPQTVGKEAALILPFTRPIKAVGAVAGMPTMVKQFAIKNPKTANAVVGGLEGGVIGGATSGGDPYGALVGTTLGSGLAIPFGTASTSKAQQLKNIHSQRMNSPAGRNDLQQHGVSKDVDFVNTAMPTSPRKYINNRGNEQEAYREVQRQGAGQSRKDSEEAWNSRLGGIKPQNIQAKANANDMRLTPEGIELDRTMIAYKNALQPPNVATKNKPLTPIQKEENLNHKKWVDLINSPKSIGEQASLHAKLRAMLGGMRGNEIKKSLTESQLKEVSTIEALIAGKEAQMQMSADLGAKNLAERRSFGVANAFQRTADTEAGRKLMTPNRAIPFVSPASSAVVGRGVPFIDGYEQ